MSLNAARNRRWREKQINQYSTLTAYQQDLAPRQYLACKEMELLREWSMAALGKFVREAMAVSVWKWTTKFD